MQRMLWEDENGKYYDGLADLTGRIFWYKEITKAEYNTECEKVRKEV